MCLNCSAGVMRGHQVGRITEKMSIAGFARARLTGEDSGEWARFVAGSVGRGASGKALEGGLNSGEVVEAVEAIGPAAQFAGGLRAAEEKETENGGLVASQVQDRADAVLVLGDAGVANRSYESEVFKRVKRLANLFLAEIEDRFAAGPLVARVDQGVEREWVVFWCGDLFFNQRAEDTELDGIEVHVYKGAIAEGSVGTDDNE